MKRSAIGCSKMLDLMEALDVPQYVAVGILESLWHFTAKEAPQGNIGKIEDRKIARAIGWQGEATKLIDCLVETHWLDRDDEHRLLVHDWHEHCDDANKKVVARSGKPFLTSSKTTKYMRSVVYAIQGVDSKKIKIGVTETSAQARLEALQTGSAEILTLLGSTPGTRTLEQSLHKQWSKYKIKGEWFSPNQVILDEVSRWQTAADVVSPPEPCLSLALPKPEPQPDAHTQPLEELPERLRTESFRDAWTAWEQYRKQSDWGCVQPISRVQVWKKLEPLGANEAENRVRTAVAKGYRNIVDDAVLSIPNGKVKGPEPPKRTYKDSTALRIAAEKRCAELEQSGMEPEDMIESLVKEFGHDLPSTIRSKLTKQIHTTGKEKAEK